MINQVFEQRINALRKIRSRYQSVIDSDAILTKDFDTLIECCEHSDAIHTKNFYKVMGHLIAESHEAVEDIQRMDDESPICLPDDSECLDHQQRRQNFKNALDAYQVNYLT